MTTIPASGKNDDHPTHIAALDGVRALSICFVLAAHMLPLGPKNLALNAMSAKMGMSLFFCLSGFLIVSMLHRNPDVPTFLIRRLLRIVPAVVLYLLILVVLTGISWKVVGINIAFMSNYLTEGLTGGSLGHFWSLSVEMHFYIAMALLTLLLGRRSVWLVIPAALMITLLRVDAGAYVNIKTHLRVDEILSGGILALATLSYGDKFRVFLASSPRAVVILAMTTLLWMVSCRDDAGALNYLRPYLAASVVGIVIHCQLRPLLRVLEGPIAAYIARISYALYIYHFLTISGWMNNGSDLTRYLVKRPISFALTFGLAHASTFWWEAYWQKLARRLTPRAHKKSHTDPTNRA